MGQNCVGLVNWRFNARRATANSPSAAAPDIALAWSVLRTRFSRRDFLDRRAVDPIGFRSTSIACTPHAYAHRGAGLGELGDERAFAGNLAVRKAAGRRRVTRPALLQRHDGLLSGPDEIFLPEALGKKTQILALGTRAYSIESFLSTIVGIAAARTDCPARTRRIAAAHVDMGTRVLANISFSFSKIAARALA